MSHFTLLPPRPARHARAGVLSLSLSCGFRMAPHGAALVGRRRRWRTALDQLGGFRRGAARNRPEREAGKSTLIKGIMGVLPRWPRLEDRRRGPRRPGVAAAGRRAGSQFSHDGAGPGGDGRLAAGRRLAPLPWRGTRRLHAGAGDRGPGRRGGPAAWMPVRRPDAARAVRAHAGAQDASVLLLDEPFAAVDSHTADQLMALLCGPAAGAAP